MTNKKYVFNIILSVLLVALAIILGTIFDLSISKSLCILEEGEYYSSNFFVAFFEIFGEAILYILLACAFAIIYDFFYKKNTSRKVLKTVILIACSILELASIFLVFHNILGNAFDHSSPQFEKFFSYFQSKVFVVALSGLISYFVIYLFSKLSYETLSNLIKWAVIILLVVVLSNGIVKLLKIIMHRTRFRAMLFVGDTEFNYYTNWFVINKKTFSSVLPMASDFFKSFPSGHACAGTSIFLLCLLPMFTQRFNTKKWKITFITISSIYVFLLDLSRIICGAHFLTDVFIGSFITIGIMFLINLFYKKWFYKFFEKLNNF